MVDEGGPWAQAQLLWLGRAVASGALREATGGGYRRSREKPQGFDGWRRALTHLARDVPDRVNTDREWLSFGTTFVWRHQLRNGCIETIQVRLQKTLCFEFGATIVIVQFLAWTRGYCFCCIDPVSFQHSKLGWCAEVSATNSLQNLAESAKRPALSFSPSVGLDRSTNWRLATFVISFRVPSQYGTPDFHRCCAQTFESSLGWELDWVGGSFLRSCGPRGSRFLWQFFLL